MSEELTIADLAKLKVNDLKKELKNRDLPVSGNKSELLERLEEALKAEEAEALLDEPEGESKDDLPSAAEIEAEPEPLKKEPEVKSSPAKAVTPAVQPAAAAVPAEDADKKPADVKAEETDPEKKKLSRAERFGIVSDDAVKSKRAERFGIVSEEDKKAQRAAKFGTAVENTTSSAGGGDSDAKKAKRAERFGIVAADTAADKAKSAGNAEMSEEERARLLKRKERFGEVTSKTVEKVETDEKIKQRAARFGAISATVVTVEDDDRKKKRMERFAAA